MDFIHQHNFTHIDSEKISKDSPFEIGSYRPTKDMIEEFILSGKMLESSRQLVYDDVEDDGTFVLDPTRHKNFDLVDASNIVNQLNDKLKKARSDVKSESVATKTNTERLAAEALASDIQTVTEDNN